MDKKRFEKAVEKHDDGMNCAQAVLASLSDKTGLSEFDSKKLAACFGGGVRAKELCGAVAGAAMALGMCVAEDGIGSKESCSAKAINEFTALFSEEFSSLRCDALVEKNGKELCKKYMGFSAEEAEKIIDKMKREE